MIATVALLARLDVARIWWRRVGAAAVSAGVAHLDRAGDDSGMSPVGVRTVRDN